MSKESDNWDDFTVDEGAADASPLPGQPSKAPKDPTGIRWSLISGLILIAAITILAAQNTQNVVLKFLGWDGRAPLIAIILGTAIVAIIIDEAVGFIWRRRRKKALAEREELKKLRARSD